MKKLFVIFGIALFASMLFAGNAFAKVQPSAKITVSYALRSDNHALEISFGQLQNATSVHYEVTYTGDKVAQGAIGDLNLHGQSTQSAEVVFGTCSQGVCRYYTKVKDLKLKVTAVLTNGKNFHQNDKIDVK